MKNKYLAVIFIMSIFLIPFASIVQKDVENSKILNRNLQTDILNGVSINKESFFNKDISNSVDTYLEDQIIGHEFFFNIKKKFDYNTGKNNSSTYYYIPNLDISYQYDKNELNSSFYISDYDELCKENPKINFYYYVVPSKRNSIPDEFIKYDYNQEPKKKRQEKVNEILNSYECVETTYHPEILDLTDYYPYNHHYNSKGIYKVYTDFVKSYNKLYNEDYEIIKPEELEKVKVSSEYYINDVDNSYIENYTTEYVIPGTYNSEGGNSYKKLGLSRGESYINEEINETNSENILLIGDSFAEGIAPYMSEMFYRLDFIDYYEYKAGSKEKIQKIIDENEYDTIIIYTYDSNVLNNTNGEK